MAKVTLEFDPFEDREDMESAINGWKWKMLAWDLDQWMRGEMKYAQISQETYDAYETIREKIRTEMAQYGLSLD